MGVREYIPSIIGSYNTFSDLPSPEMQDLHEQELYVMIYFLSFFRKRNFAKIFWQSVCLFLRLSVCLSSFV